MNHANEPELEGYVITFRKEIIFYLRQLIHTAAQVTVHFNEGRDSFLTLLLDVDEHARRLIVDWGGSEEENRRFLQSERGVFVAHPDGIRHQFAAGPALAIEFHGRRAFALPLPERFARMQRREFFRLVLPLSQRPPFMLPAGSAGGLPHPERVEVIDLSLGGVGLEVPTLPQGWDSDLHLHKVLMDLGHFGPVVTSMRVCYTAPVERGQRRFYRIGCRFEALTHTQEVELQRFISHVQREERARLG